MSQLEQIINNLWGEPIANHVSVKRLVLTVEVNDPAWAAQVAFLKQRILSTFSANGLPITDIDVKVRRVY